ncbi:MAG: Grx4 family monothiol glutaredoxin [Micavibrio sp.]|nr:Grx4 family monothiol glutaredoxin [Micavibrio sp.]
MSNPALETIQKEIDNNDVVLFMKGEADAPMCGFSSMVVQVLRHTGVEFKDVNVLADNDLRQGIKDFTNWPTIPQLYIKGEFVGGCDIVREMYESGELKGMLEANGVKTA